MSSLPQVPLIRQRALVATFVAGGSLTTINITLISPLLKPIAEDFNVFDSTAGQLSTVTAVCAFVTALVVAPLMDRYSLRTWLRFEAALVAVGALLSALAPTFAFLFVGRAAAGIGGAILIGICFAAAAEIFTDPNQRNRVIGVITTAATLGPMIGLPVLTQISDGAGWRWAIALLIPLCGTVLIGSHTFRGKASSPSESRKRGWFAEYQRVASQRRVMALLGTAVVLCVVRFGWLIYFGAYAETVFAVGATTLSLAFLVSGGAQIIANNVIPLLLRYHSPQKIAMLAASVMAANLFAVGVVYTERWMIFPFIVVANVCFSLCIIPQSIMLIESMPSARATLLSLQSAGWELGIALAAGVTGATLAVLDDYEATFRALGLLVPIMLALITFVSRQPRGMEIHPEVAPETASADG